MKDGERTKKLQVSLSQHSNQQNHRVTKSATKEIQASSAAHPCGSLELLVVGRRHITSDARGQGIQHNEGGEEGAAVVWVEDPHQSQPKDAKGPGHTEEGFVSPAERWVVQGTRAD
jgi:uncharacterized protein YwbE